MLDHVVIEKPSPNFGGLGVGTTVHLRAHAYDLSGNEITQGITYDWSSSDTTIVVVDPRGRISAKQSGDVTISVKATSSSRSASSSIKLSGVVPV